MKENEVSQQIISAAIEVHRTLGSPGLLESVYEEALASADLFAAFSGWRPALIINFGERYVRNGIRRVVNQ